MSVAATPIRALPAVGLTAAGRLRAPTGVALPIHGPVIHVGLLIPVPPIPAVLLNRAGQVPPARQVTLARQVLPVVLIRGAPLSPVGRLPHARLATSRASSLSLFRPRSALNFVDAWAKVRRLRPPAPATRVNGPVAVTQTAPRLMAVPLARALEPPAGRAGLPFATLAHSAGSGSDLSASWAWSWCSS